MNEPRVEVSPGTACCTGRVQGENGHLVRWSDLPGLELLTADFKRHAYLPHWHDTYTIAFVEAGCERVRLAGSERHVSPGDLVLLHPGDIHDGEAYDPAVGWKFRVFYLSSEVLFRQSTPLDEAGSREIVFRQTHLRDVALWDTLLAMHQTLSQSSELLERTSNLFLGLSKLRKYTVQSARGNGVFLPRVASLDRARQYLDANWAKAVSLEELASVAGLSRFHLIRAFRKQYGLPPHAYQIQLKILKAKSMLFTGISAGEVALASGFYDQAHLTNVLKRYVGVTPGRLSIR